PDDTVIGRLGTYRIRAGETFFEVARYYDLGYGELVEANPGIDPILPPVGARVVLPTAWILPCCTYEGIVVNVPEMRLYFYRHPPGEPRTLLVETYPIGIGREGWRTPRGKFHIRGKPVNPQWEIPESIRQEHRRALAALTRQGLGGGVDSDLVKAALRSSAGVPFRVSPAGVPARTS